MAALEQWTLPQLSKLLPLENSELTQVVAYTKNLSDNEAANHLKGLLGDSPQAVEFITSFIEHKSSLENPASKSSIDTLGSDLTTHSSHADVSKGPVPITAASVRPNGQSSVLQNGGDTQKTNGIKTDQAPPRAHPPPVYQPPPGQPTHAIVRAHTNQVIEAGRIRARDETEMQNMLQTLQFQYQIYNSDIEPEHDVEYVCYCPIHQYNRRKWQRTGVQNMWSEAVMYPGEKAYTNMNQGASIFVNNPYRYSVISPYGRFANNWGPSRPKPGAHAQSIHQTIDLNNSLNRKAQANINAIEPKLNIWDDDHLENAVSRLSISGKSGEPQEKAMDEKQQQLQDTRSNRQEQAQASSKKPSRLASIRKSIGIKTQHERAVSSLDRKVGEAKGLRNAILAEERGKWPDANWRQIVANYQDKVGMTGKIAELRARYPIQYLHLLRAGYFEPIPVAWANQISNPLKFTIEAAAGWRGITPAWRGYEDTAEERLYWVLNHREGSVGMRMKPDFISEMNMARARMATAVEPPPEYYSVNDTCHLQHTSEGYSLQVMPPPFVAFDRPEQPTDDTMILLDVSGSMDFDPTRPVYNQYLITHYVRSTQPRNKDVAKAVIRRFADAMSNHDHNFQGYDLVTFSDRSKHMGTINHQNLETTWRNIRFGGGTRVMTGWQKVKELHFQKHSESATHHPVYGWQAGPETPMLRLLLLLDGEATDMDEFELDLLSISWAHVTVFLIGVDGCPHHHRHANELQRISDVNHHVSFVDAQGNTPERFVTHELLKRHLGYEMSFSEFESVEELPAYAE